MSTALTPDARLRTLLRMGFTYTQIAALLDADPADVVAWELNPASVPTLYLGN